MLFKVVSTIAKLNMVLQEMEMAIRAVRMCLLKMMMITSIRWIKATVSPSKRRYFVGR